MTRKVINQTSKWVEKLLSACNNDEQLAKRQLVWLKEKVVSDFGGDPSKSFDLLSIQEQNKLDSFINQRSEQHKPLQYILGDQPFCEIDILTRPPILIPRWETEEWVYKLIDLIQFNNPQKQNLKILDLCTGSGCISLALAKHLPKKSVDITGIDISTEAISLANSNLEKHQHLLQNKVEFLQEDVFDDTLKNRIPNFNLIVSNPPYVTKTEYESLDPDVKNWEDQRALVAEDDGTAVHKRIIEVAKYCTPWTKMAPYLYMEIGGSHQVPILENIMKKNGFNNFSVWKDLADKDRVVTGF